jgi:hypothetical protein
LWAVAPSPASFAYGEFLWPHGVDALAAAPEGFGTGVRGARGALAGEAGEAKSELDGNVGISARYLSAEVRSALSALGFLPVAGDGHISGPQAAATAALEYARQARVSATVRGPTARGQSETAIVAFGRAAILAKLSTSIQSGVAGKLAATSPGIQCSARVQIKTVGNLGWVVTVPTAQASGAHEPDDLQALTAALLGL